MVVVFGLAGDFAGRMAEMMMAIHRWEHATVGIDGHQHHKGRTKQQRRTYYEE